MVRNQKAKETTKGKEFAKKAIEKVQTELRGPSHHSCKESRRSPRSHELAKQLGLKLVLEGDENYANNNTAAIGQNYQEYSGSIIPNKIILPDLTSNTAIAAERGNANEKNKHFCCSSSENLSVGVGVEIETSALRN